MSERVYLPMDCPICGRSRVEWNGRVLRCEKCTTSSEFGGFTEDRYKASQPLIARVRELEEALGGALNMASDMWRDDPLYAALRSLLSKGSQ